jgi:hypothetical protein
MLQGLAPLETALRDMPDGSCTSVGMFALIVRLPAKRAALHVVFAQTFWYCFEPGL